MAQQFTCHACGYTTRKFSRLLKHREGAHGIIRERSQYAKFYDPTWPPYFNKKIGGEEE